jgi:flagellar hook assembly protein FlgD
MEMENICLRLRPLQVPREIVLAQNVPNPFNPVTEIPFTVAHKQHVRISVYDTSGRLVRALIDEERLAGTHLATWDGRSDQGTLVSSGVYFCRLRAGKTERSIRMVLLK